MLNYKVSLVKASYGIKSPDSLFVRAIKVILETELPRKPFQERISSDKFSTISHLWFLNEASVNPVT